MALDPGAEQMGKVNYTFLVSQSRESLVWFGTVFLFYFPNKCLRLCAVCLWFQVTVCQVSQETQRADELPGLHAERWGEGAAFSWRKWKLYAFYCSLDDVRCCAATLYAETFQRKVHSCVENPSEKAEEWEVRHWDWGWDCVCVCVYILHCYEGVNHWLTLSDQAQEHLKFHGRKRGGGEGLTLYVTVTLQQGFMHGWVWNLIDRFCCGRVLVTLIVIVTRMLELWVKWCSQLVCVAQGVGLLTAATTGDVVSVNENTLVQVAQRRFECKEGIVVLASGLFFLLNNCVPLSCPGRVRVQEGDCRLVSGCFIKWHCVCVLSRESLRTRMRVRTVVLLFY